MSSPSKTLATALASTTLFLSTTSLAHHPMGGETPGTYLHGFLSGLAHPIIGIDHFAFIIGVGIVLGFGALRGLTTPLMLIAAAIAGTTLSWSGFTFPATELMVALSLLGVAATVFLKPQYKLFLTVTGSAAAFFHGQAYAGAVLGAETSPLVAYLTGFTITQFSLAAAAYLLTRWLLANHQKLSAMAQTAAASAIGGIGLISVASTVIG